MRTNHCIDRQAMVRLRVRPRSSWSSDSQLHFQHDVSTPLTKRNASRTKLPRLLLGFFKPLIYTHSRSKLFGTRVLPPSLGVYKLTRGRSSSRHLPWLLRCEHCYCMVYLLELCYVLRCRADDTDAISGRLSAGFILYWIRVDGDFLESRDWAHGCYECCGLSEVGRILHVHLASYQYRRWNDSKPNSS